MALNNQKVVKPKRDRTNENFAKRIETDKLRDSVGIDKSIPIGLAKPSITDKLIR